MITIQNKSLNFTILYLPDRSLRFKGKQVREITEEEFKSDEFQLRRNDFRIIEMPKTEEILEEEKVIERRRKSKKRVKEEIDIIENEASIIDVESEPDVENGSL